MDIAVARQIAGDSDISDRLYLVRNGIPFDVAMSLDPEVRVAWVVILGQQDGHEFDWDTLTWSKRDG